MSSLTRLAKCSYLLAFTFVVFLLLPVKPSQAQSGVTAGYRGVPPLNITIPVFSGSGSSFGGGFGSFGFVGGFGGNSFSFQTTTIRLGSPFPLGWGMPPPPLILPLNNFGPIAPVFGFAGYPLGFAGFPPFLGFPSFSDSTGAPWSLFTALGPFARGGITGLGGFGVSGIGGFGIGGVSVTGGFGFGGMGGFAGKGLGGFGGRKGL